VSVYLISVASASSLPSPDVDNGIAWKEGTGTSDSVAATGIVEEEEVAFALSSL